MGQGSARPVILPQLLSMGYLSGDNERLELCPRVQTPAPGLGRLHATVPGICSVQTRSRRTLPDLVVGSTPLHNPAARSVLETAPCRWCSRSALRSVAVEHSLRLFIMFRRRISGSSTEAYFPTPASIQRCLLGSEPTGLTSNLLLNSTQ